MTMSNNMFYNDHLNCKILCIMVYYYVKQGFNTWGATCKFTTLCPYLRQADRLNSVLGLGGLGQGVWHTHINTFDT